VCLAGSSLAFAAAGWCFSFHLASGMDFQENEQAASHQSPVCQASINFRRSYSHQRREGREEGRPTAAVARLETRTQCAHSENSNTCYFRKYAFVHETYQIAWSKNKLKIFFPIYGNQQIDI
jgi:hypothetical protein